MVFFYAFPFLIIKIKVVVFRLKISDAVKLQIDVKLYLRVVRYLSSRVSYYFRAI